MKPIFLLFLFSFISSSKKFKLNELFFYDPISDSPCDYTNYWTPFNMNTTCYRWVNLNPNDTEDNDSIMIMVDNNIRFDNYTRIDFLLKVLKAKWKRYTGEIFLPDEDILYNLMKYKNLPEIDNPSKPSYVIGEMILNNQYTIKGGKRNSYGYWLNKTYDKDYAYTINERGYNVLVKKKEKRGIRPVIIIKKDLLNIMPDAIDITDLVKEGKLYKYLYENKTHGGVYYKSLQAFTIVKDRLIYTSSNNDNSDYCMLYSYKGDNYSELDKSLYDKCGHGNGIAWDSKKDKLFVTSAANWSQINQYDPYNLTYETYYSKNDSYTHFDGIEYNWDNDYYIGYNDQRELFQTTTKDKFPVQYSFSYPQYETPQDPGYYKGLVFFPCADLGAPNQYQEYSMWGKGNGIIYVYNLTLNEDSTHTKDYGRLIGRLIIKQMGEIEAVAIRDDRMTLGFSCKNIDPDYTFKFYEIDYNEVMKRILNQKIIYIE